MGYLLEGTTYVFVKNVKAKIPYPDHLYLNAKKDKDFALTYALKELTGEEITDAKVIKRKEAEFIEIPVYLQKKMFQNLVGIAKHRLEKLCDATKKGIQDVEQNEFNSLIFQSEFWIIEYITGDPHFIVVNEDQTYWGPDNMFYFIRYLNGLINNYSRPIYLAETWWWGTQTMDPFNDGW